MLAPVVIIAGLLASLCIIYATFRQDWQDYRARKRQRIADQTVADAVAAEQAARRRPTFVKTEGRFEFDGSGERVGYANVWIDVREHPVTMLFPDMDPKVIEPGQTQPFRVEEGTDLYLKLQGRGPVAIPYTQYDEEHTLDIGRAR